MCGARLAVAAGHLGHEGSGEGADAAHVHGAQLDAAAHGEIHEVAEGVVRQVSCDVDALEGSVPRWQGEEKRRLRGGGGG